MYAASNLLVAYLRSRLGDGERGASLVEYALIVAVIAVACIGGVTLLGHSAAQQFSAVGASIGS